MVDQDLENGDVRLTMGGEPTFVSIDDMESAQWNTAALGKHKLERAHDLFERLSQQYGAGGLLHYGQGKWYPGEPLPRWALNYYWRKDGAPVWRNPDLIAKDDDTTAFTAEHASVFTQRLSQTLGLSPKYIVPGYEDAVYYLWKEGNLPENLDPLQHELKQEDERRKLLEVIAAGLGEPRGYALPMQWDEQTNHWQSSLWTFNRKHMYLIPGDSPMGLRLPLDSLPWEKEKEKEKEFQHEQSLFEPLPPLGDYYGEVARRFSYFSEDNLPPDTLVEQEYADGQPNNKTGKKDNKKLLHTDICVEARENHLYVFLPPLSNL